MPTVLAHFKLLFEMLLFKCDELCKSRHGWLWFSQLTVNLFFSVMIRPLMNSLMRTQGTTHWMTVKTIRHLWHHIKRSSNYTSGKCLWFCNGDFFKTTAKPFHASWWALQSNPDWFSLQQFKLAFKPYEHQSLVVQKCYQIKVVLCVISKTLLNFKTGLTFPQSCPWVSLLHSGCVCRSVHRCENLS